MEVSILFAHFFFGQNIGCSMAIFVKVTRARTTRSGKLRLRNIVHFGEFLMSRNWMSGQAWAKLDNDPAGFYLESLYRCKSILCWAVNTWAYALCARACELDELFISCILLSTERENTVDFVKQAKGIECKHKHPFDTPVCLVVRFTWDAFPLSHPLSIRPNVFSTIFSQVSHQEIRVPIKFHNRWISFRYPYSPSPVTGKTVEQKFQTSVHSVLEFFLCRGNSIKCTTRFV